MCFHFIILLLSITTYYYLMNTSDATTIIVMLCLFLFRAHLFINMIILQPLAPKAKNFYFYYDVAMGPV